MGKRAQAPKEKVTAQAKKEAKAALFTATPKGKAAVVAAEGATPDDPKRRKVDPVVTASKAEAVPSKPVEELLKSHKENMAATAVPSKVVADAVMAAASGDSGPWSMWSGPAGDAKALVSPAFDPSLRIAEYPIGKPVGFELLSGALSEIEALKGSGQGSRKKMTIILSNLFRLILQSRPADLVPTLYILSNKVAPDYEESELGIGDQVILKAMGETFGRSEAQMKGSFLNGEAKDLGEVALLSRVAQKMLMMPAKLTIEKVFNEMKALAALSGKDSGRFRKEKISKMLVASRGEEAKFIVRMLQCKLRIGIQMPTVLQAVAYAFSLTTPARGSGADAVPFVADMRKIKGMKQATLEPRMVGIEAAVKQAYCECPNLDMVTAALMDGCDEVTLAQRCHIALGIPVKPMLAKPSKGIGEVVERLGGMRFTGEWKYDGERAQIHYVSKDKIFVFSRNSENMTEKYPDVIKVVQETICDGTESCIIDAELVAYDQTTKKILPFQVLSTRGRKNIVVEDIKVNVCLFCFDCMLCNGQPLVQETLEYRRNKLWSLIKETEGKVKFATYKNFDELKEEEVQQFLDESIEGSCEGLMLKTLTENATYMPSKRSLNWLKLKKDYIDGLGDSLDVVPIGGFYGKGKRTGAYGAFLLAIWDADNEEYQTVCKAGTGFSDEDLQQHYAFFKERTLEKPESNYNVSDKIKPDVWFEACQVWEIKAADLSISPVHTSAIGQKADGKGIGLRFPRFLRIRDDKQPEDSTSAEQVVEMFEAQASISSNAGGRDDDDY